VLPQMMSQGVANIILKLKTFSSTTFSVEYLSVSQFLLVLCKGTRSTALESAAPPKGGIKYIIF